MNFVAAILYGVSSATLASLVLGFHGLTAQCAFLSLAIGCCVAAAALRFSQPTEASTYTTPTFPGWASITLFALFSLRSFLWLIYRDRDSIRVLSPNNLGDLSLHLNYIRHLASGVPLWPDNTIVAGAKLSYPLGLDLFNALLTLAGLDEIRGLIWVGLAGCLLTGITLWKWGGAFTLAGFLCNGGLLGFALFHSLTLEDFQSDAAWKSIPLALFVTQRGFLFAIPAGLALLCSWRSRLSGSPEQKPLPFAGELLLYASMPLFHVHTFLFLSFLLAFWFLCIPSVRPYILKLVAAAFLPASIPVWLVTGMLKGPSMLGWNPGWMQGSQNFLLFWLLNFGFLPLLVFLLCRALWKRPTAIWPAAFTGPALLVFFICCFIKFAPWPWDNSKLMVWSYLTILPILWSQLLSTAPALWRMVSCFFLFFSGLVSLAGGLLSSGTGYEIAQRSELDAIEQMLQAVPPTETIAIAPEFNHPVILAGRKVLMGYEGHVWSHGYDLPSRKAQLEFLMNGNEGWQTLSAGLHVRYLFWGTREEKSFPESTQPWKLQSLCVSSGKWGNLYDLQSPATSF